MRKGLTLLELLIIGAILSLLAAIAVPNFQAAMKKAELMKTTVTPVGGGDGMFRFAELLVILAMLYLIANISHYFVMKAMKSEGTGGDIWFFKLSDKWLEAERSKAEEAERRKSEEAMAPKKGNKR